MVRSLFNPRTLNKFMSSVHLPSSFIALILLQSTILYSAETPDTTPLQLTAEYARSTYSWVEGPPTSLGSVIESTGTSPEAIAQWVKSNIQYESYAGVRKGSEGTLISGVGNSADQALLIASLFEYVGIPAKLVNGTISETELPKPSLSVAKDLNELPSANEMETLSQKTGIGIESVYNYVEGALRSRQTFLERLWSRTLSDLDVLSTALDDAGVPLPKTKNIEPVDVDHWWVRTEEGDYDTVLEKTLSDENAQYALNELPESLFQKVKVRMWIQRSEDSDDGKIIMEPESVLDVTFHSSELFGSPLLVGNIPLDIESQLSSLQNPTPDQIIKVFQSASQFQPQLSSPRGLLSGLPFDKSGVKLQIKDDRIESVKKIGGSMGGLFGGTMGGGQSQKPKSHLIAHWLEIELEGSQGQDTPIEPVIIRRDLLRNPSSETNSLEILSMREILIHADELNSAWLTRKSLLHMADTAEFTKLMFEQGNPEGKSGTALFELISDHPRLTHELFGFGLARKNELLRLREKMAPQARFKKDYPLVVSVMRGFNCPNDEIHVRSGLDILYQAFKVQGHRPESWKQSLTFAAGVLDTSLELAIMERMHAPEKIRNASIALEKALASGSKPKVVVEENSIQLQIIDIPTGEVLAYYEVAPDSGMSLGMMDGGGQAMTDYSEETSVVLQLKGTFEFYGNLFKCIGLSITRPLAGGARSHDVQLAKCVWEVACSQIAGLVGTFVPVDTNWTNIIAQEAVNYLFGEVCSQISDQIK